MSADMSGGAAVQAAVVALLAANPALAGARVFDAAPVRAAPPYLVVDEPVLADWGAKGWTGREGTVAVLLFDAGAGGGERPARLRALAGAVEAAMPGLGPDLGSGWRLAGVRLSRSRIARADADRWRASVEWRVRIFARTSRRRGHVRAQAAAGPAGGGASRRPSDVTAAALPSLLEIDQGEATCRWKRVRPSC